MRDSTAAANPSAPSGKSLRYAKPERERRFLLAKMPPGAAEGTAHIVDRYFVGTRLRLRQMIETRGTSQNTYYKLTQKVPAPDGGPGLLSTIYLSTEVTRDSRFTGGHYSTMQSGDLVGLLSAFGFQPADS